MKTKFKVKLSTETKISRTWILFKQNLIIHTGDFLSFARSEFPVDKNKRFTMT